ncbi:MAG: DMT family transporter [Muribaculaceae bacterium]|nr:DMT family transporter [Muribaculaceae bacterium]
MHFQAKTTQTPRGGQLLGHVAALLSVCMWGYSFVSSKVLIENGLGPVHIFFYRFLLAYAVMLAICHKRFFASNWRDEGLFLLCGISSGSLYFIAENTALEYTLATNVSLLTSLSPLFTAIFAGLVYKTEKLGRGIWIGSCIAIVGVVCVVLNSSTSLEVRPLGDMLSLAAALCWTFYSLLLRSLNANYDVWFITRKTFFYGLITSIPCLFFEHNAVPFAEAIHLPAVYGNLLFLGLGASAIAFLLWSVSIKQIGPVKANNYMYFQTIVTLVISALVLDEHVTTVGYIGIALIIGGLYVGDNIDKLRARRTKRLS